MTITVLLRAHFHVRFLNGVFKCYFDEASVAKEPEIEGQSFVQINACVFKNNSESCIIVHFNC